MQVKYFGNIAGNALLQVIWVPLLLCLHVLTACPVSAETASHQTPAADAVPSEERAEISFEEFRDEESGWHMIKTFFSNYGSDIAVATYEHIYLVLISLIAAVFIAVPTGIYLTRCPWPRLIAFILGLVGIIQTIPALALIAFIVILFAALPFPTIGRPPALLALVLYALLPILRNTYTGINHVDPAIKEVARGMGMRQIQMLLKVELPLALPVIMAGIRIAAVWTIGVATLCGLIGAGGLGELIFRGLRVIRLPLLIAGTVPAALLAICSDWLLGRLEAWFTPAGLWK